MPLSSYLPAGYKLYYQAANTEAALADAVSAAQTNGGGVVVLAPGVTTLTAPVADLTSNVSFIGPTMVPTITMTGDIPDYGWTLSTGSSQKGATLAGDGTFACFRANYTDKVSEDADFTDNALIGVEIAGIGFDNFTSAIQIGGENNIGAIHGKFHHLYATNCTDFAFKFNNFQHCEFYAIKGDSNKGGIWFGSPVASTTLQCGNSVHEDIMFNTINDLKARGIVYSAGYTGIDGTLNQMSGNRVQCNHFNRSLSTQAATMTNLSSSIAVADSSIYSVGMPVTVNTSANGFTANLTYVVLTIPDSTHITLGLTLMGSAVTATGSSAINILTYGFPNIEVIPQTSNSHVTHGDLLALDVEGAATCHIYVENGQNVFFNIAQWGTTQYNGMTARNSNTCKAEALHDVYGDFDGNSVKMEVSGQWKGFRNRYPYGVWYDTTNNRVGFGGDSYNGHSLTSTDTSLMKFWRGLCFGSKPNDGTGSVSFSDDDCVHIAEPGSGTPTRTLPAITDNNIGRHFVICNNGSVAISVATSSSQVFARAGSDTSTAYSLAAGHVLKLWATKTSGGTFKWIAEDDALIT